MIRYVTPYAADKNLARAYNLEMELAPPGSYVAFIDRDAYFPHPHFGSQIEAVIQEHGPSFYTCYTNRTNCGWQRLNVMGNDRYHAEVAQIQWETWGTAVAEHTSSQLWSGHLMICPKDLWKPLPPRKGLLGIDNEIHKRASKILLMKGVYLWHYYSGFDGENGNRKRDKSHLI